MLKNCLKVLVVLTLVLGFPFICVGYANLVDEMEIEGTVTAMTDIWELLKKEPVTGSVKGQLDTQEIEIFAGVHIGYGDSTENATLAAFGSNSSSKQTFLLYKIRDLDGDGQSEYFAEIDASSLFSVENKSVLICIIPGYEDDEGEQLVINTATEEHWRADEIKTKLKDCDFVFDGLSKYFLVIYGVDLINKDVETEGIWRLCKEVEFIEILKGKY